MIGDDTESTRLLRPQLHHSEDSLVGEGYHSGGGGGGDHNQDDTDTSSTQAHHHHRHISHSVPVYARPKQRQRWGEKQVLPHVNWGDLFFDLYYVAFAYNLSHGFSESPNLEGLLYFAACYLPVFIIWNEKLILDSRYWLQDDILHSSLDVVQLMILACAVWHIESCEVMRDTTNNSTILVFSGSFIASSLYYIYLYLDIYLHVDGGEEAKNNARFSIKRKVISMILYIVAFGIAARDYYWTGGRLTKLSVDTDGQEEEREEEGKPNHWPAILLLSAYIVEFVIFNLLYAFWMVPMSGLSIKQLYVPLNLEFLTHRIGEWVMLMLGESVLSILTNKGGDDGSWAYSISVYTGVLTVTLFQYLFFRSQPADGRHHALHRSRLSGYLYYYGHTVYSASLIILGSSFKMLLSAKGAESQRDPNDTLIINRRIASVYAISQAMCFVSMDFMSTTHTSFRLNLQRFFPPDGKFPVAPWLIFAWKSTLMIMTLYLSTVHDLTTLSVLGCLLVFANVLVRTIWFKYFPMTDDDVVAAVHHHYGSTRHLPNRRWPNITEPGNDGGS